MKALTFKYTKKDGSVSERTLLTMVEPTDKYAGIDVSELDEPIAMEFIERAEALHDKYLEGLKALQDQYDLKFKYRSFFENKMEDVVQI